jgi:hypothetical protein
VIFLWLSKRSRERNDDLRAKGKDSPIEAYLAERRKGNVIKAYKAYFSGSVTAQEAAFGRFLAYAVIIFVSIFLVLGCLIILNYI